MSDFKKEKKENTFEFNACYSSIGIGIGYIYLKNTIQPNVISIDFLFWNMNFVW